MEDNTVLPAGVVQLLQWTMMSDGTTYMAVWAKSWKIVTNKASGIDGLHTHDRYHLACYGADGKVKGIFPGCQVKAYVACEANPSYKGGTQAFTM
jgi:hypothetical protein